jgi:hypothetical protein
MSTQPNNTNKNTGVRLSYSSMKLLQSCEQRYHHYKVTNTPKDSDYVESDSLGLGKAFHQVLEKTLHASWNESLLMEAMSDHGVDVEDTQLLQVMLEKYIEFRKASGLTVVKCEFGIETSMYTGFIDAIAVDKVSKLWWLVDLKTAGRHDPNLLPQLSKDMQIGLYSYFSPDIELYTPELEGYTFAGFKYSQTIKSKAQSLVGLEKGVKVYEMTVPAELIKNGEAWSLFSEVHDRALELHKGESPRKNYSACFNYFSPCPYFSQCHGVKFSEGNPKVTIETIETLNDKELL